MGFHGGVHPPEEKLTRNKQIEVFPIPERLVVPLLQHTGKISKPIVDKREYVLKGQALAEPDGKISTFIHAPTSGRVKDIIDWLHPTIGKKIPSIIIEPDGKDVSIEKDVKYKEYFRYTSQELLDVIEGGGIVGLGGAMFPTHIKLRPPKAVDTLILNGCECEPYITCDERLLIEHPREIIDGLKIMMYIVRVNNAIVVIEDNKPEAIKSMQGIIFEEPNIHLMVVKTKYPQGSEKQLIKTVLNREVPPNGLPFDVGVIVQNVGTSYAINELITKGEALISRVVTVSGESVEGCGNYRIRIGTLVSDIIKQLKISNDYDKIIFGGPMMGISQPTPEVPIIKGTTAVLFMKNHLEKKYYSCMRCGRCIRSCPMHLMPNLISVYAERKMWERVARLFPQDCIECGCCKFVCPANRPLLEHIKLAKSILS